MSVSAYRVIEIKHDEAEAFNLSHDGAIRDFLENEGCMNQLNCDGCGILTIDMEQMKRMLETVATEFTGQLQRDYRAAVAAQADWIEYYCF